MSYETGEEYCPKCGETDHHAEEVQGIRVRPHTTSKRLKTFRNTLHNLL